MTEQKNIPVYFVTNWDMVGYTATTMASLLSNTKRNCVFYVMDCGLSAFDRKQLSTLKDRFPNLKSLSFAAVDMKRFEGMATWYFNAYDAWAAVLFPEAFPEVKGKVIHVESDTLFVDDVEKLYNEDMAGFGLAACPEIQYNNTHTFYQILMREGINPNYKYFNLGMMMIDCDFWRENNVSQKILELGKKYGLAFNCLHQDALNKYFLSNYKPLKNRYNLAERRNIVKDIIPELSDEYFIKEWKTPVIIHFSPNKPWRTQSSFFSGRISRYFYDWWYYASMTPYIEGLKNCFIAQRISDGFKGFLSGADDYGNNQMDTLRTDHAWHGLQGHDGTATTTSYRNYQNNIVSKNVIVAQKSQHVTVSSVIYYKSFGLPLMKVKTDDRGSKHYKLFWFLPVFKIKNDSKGGRTYKLFSFFPLWKIKHK